MVVLAALALSPLSGSAASWSVEQDGSGDFLEIQPAVDAAAAGDSIMIGPGNYNQLHEGLPNTSMIVFSDQQKDLVFIGANREEVIIGPELFTPDSYGFLLSNNSSYTFRKLTLANLYRGIDVGGDIHVSECTILNCDEGIVSDQSNSGDFSECVFESDDLTSHRFGLMILYAGTVRIAACEFVEMGLDLNRVDDVEVQGCTFTSQDCLAYLSGHSVSGLFENIESNSQVWFEGICNVLVRDCRLEAPDCYLSFAVQDPETIVEAHGNFFDGGSMGSLVLINNSTLLASGNHFINTTGSHAVLIFDLDHLPLVEVDLRNNYWGTTDPDSIAAMIWDINDDPRIQSRVLFQPFENEPVPTEKKSMGGIRAMYR